MENKEENYVQTIVEDLDELSLRSEEVDVKKENNEVRDLVLKLKRTLRAHEDGVGLAAPQIGVKKRVFCINFKGDIRSYINPVISNAENLVINREGCLSLPGKQYLIPRYNKISVMYQTPLGKIESVQMLGMAAFVFQHELNHLDGITLADMGLEIDEDFDKATEEERMEVVKAYMESLDLRSKDLNKQIDEDPELSKVKKAAEFMNAVDKGEVNIESEKVDEETIKKLKEKINESENKNSKGNNQ